MPPEIDENIDLRETLDAAFDAVVERDEADPANLGGTVELPAETTPPAGETKPPVQVVDPSTETTPSVGEIKPPVETTPPVAGVTSPAPPPETDLSGKPPGTWTPAAREKWKDTPPEVREEIWKREREASRAMTLSTEARKFQNEFSQTMQPYLGFIAAEKSTPMQAVNYMMQTAAALRVGTPTQKANLVAGIIKDFSIDLSALDSLLAGQTPEANPQSQVQQLVRQELAPVMQMLNSSRQLAHDQDQRLEAEITSELEQFSSDPKHEFYWDVKDTMTDIMEISARRGQQMGLTEAYDRAILIYEPVRRVIEARKQRESAVASATRARQARGSAASVTSSVEIEGAHPAKGDSLRASIEAAVDAQQGR